MPDIPIALMSLKKGKRFRVVQAFQTGCMHGYYTAYVGGGQVIADEGLEFELNSDIREGATAVNCHPIEYQTYESILVPKDVLADPKYSGYSLAISADDIDRSCEPIAD